MKTTETVIIGAGAAGLFAAAHCPKGKAIVLERNASAGKKLLISGSGRCNITHEGDIRNFFSKYGNKEKFVRHFLMAYTNRNLMQFFMQNGLRLVSDKNNKVFPESQDSRDVLKTLISACAENKCAIFYNQRVLSVHYANGLFRIETERDQYRSSNLMIATGGLSYPVTGSTGDGYTIARQLGHTVMEPRPSLSPVYIKNYAFAGLAGISLEQAEFHVYRNGRKISSLTGDVGFTHKGLSGPGILDNSRYMQEGDILKFNFTGIAADDFRAMIIESGRHEGKTALLTFLRKFCHPRSLAKGLLELTEIPEFTLMAEITKPQREKLIKHFCEYPFEIEKIGGFKTAMVTAGGVSLDEVSPKTMESKIVAGLYFAGEVLDIDGDTGGYNLQAAFSTARVAALSITAKMGS